MASACTHVAFAQRARRRCLRMRRGAISNQGASDSIAVVCQRVSRALLPSLCRRVSRCTGVAPHSHMLSCLCNTRSDVWSTVPMNSRKATGRRTLCFDLHSCHSYASALPATALPMRPGYIATRQHTTPHYSDIGGDAATPTARGAASACGCAVAQTARSLSSVGPRRSRLSGEPRAVTSASHRHSRTYHRRAYVAHPTHPGTRSLKRRPPSR